MYISHFHKSERNFELGTLGTIGNCVDESVDTRWRNSEVDVGEG